MIQLGQKDRVFKRPTDARTGLKALDALAAQKPARALVRAELLRAEVGVEQSLTFESVVGAVFQRVPLSRPLDQFVAINPLENLQKYRFADVLEWSDQWFEIRKAAENVPALNKISKEAQKWAGAFFDEGIADWPMPDKERGLWAAALALLAHDSEVKKKLKLKTEASERLRRVLQFGAAPSQAVWEQWFGFYRGLGEDSELLFDRVELLVQLNPGWASHAQRTGFHQDWVRLLMFLDLLWGNHPALTHGTIWDPRKLLSPEQESDLALRRNSELEDLERRESRYSNELIKQLIGNKSLSARTEGSPELQAVFCIDVRSEGLRRHLEESGAVETYGFAGFFGLPIEVESRAHCPILLKPSIATQESNAQRLNERRSGFDLFKKTFKQPVRNSIGGFAFVEAFGAFFALPMAVRSLWSLRKLRSEQRTLVEQLNGSSIQSSLSLEAQVQWAKSFFVSTGWGKSFAPWVLLVGHGSMNQNNPYASSLECGACGGNSGDHNARLASRILNSPDVRLALADQGIAIPSGTQFVAARHVTSTDQILILDPVELPSRWTSLMNAAGQKLCAERLSRFAGQSLTPQDAERECLQRAAGWSEVRPDWGLAGNAAFIVGDRSWTRGLDLNCRTFLHSYDPDKDLEGAVLQVILTAPLVVAQGINLQYYFSVTRPEAFGAGNKVLHNVLGGFGVMEGNQSDLKIGLPLQSVHNGTEGVHEPLRLLALVDAPQERIDRIIQSHAGLKAATENGWLRVVRLPSGPLPC